MPEVILELDSVSKHFGGLTALDNVCFSIPKGAIYGFLGPNGAGKTTTIRLILEILKPSQGTITVLGSPSALRVRQRLGYLPEEKGLYKKMKTWAVIQYFAMLKGMNRKQAKQRALALLETYGLGEFADVRVEALSKGMAQKVQVLAAVAHEPELVILDEPFSGLDPVNQSVLEDLIRHMADNGQTVIFSTHVMQHAERLCDHILLINGGHKIFDGTVHEAKSTIPRRVILETADSVTALADCEGVLAVKALEDTNPAPDVATRQQWQIQLTEQANPQVLLQACFEKGICLRRFEFSEPTLHDVFVRLVSDSAKSAAVPPATGVSGMAS